MEKKNNGKDMVRRMVCFDLWVYGDEIPAHAGNSRESGGVIADKLREMFRDSGRKSGGTYIGNVTVGRVQHINSDGQ